MKNRHKALSYVTALVMIASGIHVVGGGTPASAAAPSTSVTIDGNGSGRTFEGEGVISGGGGNTRLLIDYPEPQRSDILDYLFKPNYGAGYTTLKVEVGGDVFSTTGSEPSHARTREELANPNMHRGYELWLMSEAKKRNPNIQLDILQWGAPGWINNFNNLIGNSDATYYDNRDAKYAMFSQDNADYLVSYIKGAKSEWGLDIDYVGGNQNESFVGLDPLDPANPSGLTVLENYIINILRPTLDRNGLQDVEIVAADISGRGTSAPYAKRDWALVDRVLGNPELRDAASIIGYHYVDSVSGDIAQNSGLRLWESEGWTGTGNWSGALDLAKIMNKNYINAKITKTNVWHMIGSSYRNLSFPRTGVMVADEPWSGNYSVMPGIWAAAHTNQFAQPGWQYLDSGSGITAGGTSYVSLKEPGTSGNYSTILTTGSSAETITFNLTGGLSTNPVHVWKSNSSAQFVRQPDIAAATGSYTIDLAPNSIYSLTTTTGQQKGLSANPVPAPQPFPATHQDDFEGYATAATPKYTQDVEGVFEVADRFGGNGKALRQVVAGPMKQWDVWFWENSKKSRIRYSTFSQLGDLNWTDYTVSSDVLIEGRETDAYRNDKPGTVSIVGRAGSQQRGAINDTLTSGYKLKVDEGGNWTLSVSDLLVKSDSKILASGSVPFSARTWHNLKLSFSGTNIKGYIDGQLVTSVTDSTYAKGAAGLSSGYNYAQYDNIAIHPQISPQTQLVLADNFDDGNAEGWTTQNGSWSVVTDTSPVYQQATNTGGEAIATAGDAYWTNYDVEADLTLKSTKQGAATGIIGRYLDKNNYYLFRVSPDQVQLLKKVNGTFKTLITKPYHVELEKKYNLQLSMRGGSLTGRINGADVLTHVDSTPITTGKIGIRTYEQKATVDNVQVNSVPVEVTVDNTEPGFSTTGAWTVSTHDRGFYGTNYAHDGATEATPGSSATWTPTITEAGNYKVYMRWPATSNRPTAAPLEIKHGGSLDTSKTVNQTINSGTWVEIGTYQLTASSTDNAVTLVASAPGYSIADAVKFVKQ